MGIYDHCLLPRLCDLAMRNAVLTPYRRPSLEPQRAAF